jgi:hypothetical protein
MQPWHPASPFEEALHQSLTAGEGARVLEQLRSAELAFPLTAAAFAGEEPPSWPTTTADERTWIVAYTSTEAMRIATDQAFQHARVSSLAELAVGWPDHSWALAVNPGLPIQVLLDPATVARVAAPSLLEDREAEPTARTPLLQKLLRPTDIQELLRGATRVSGYCHQLMDVAHIATPTVLAEALVAEDEIPYYITAEGAVNMLRWPAFGLELYHSPYGGIDDASRAAVEGWLIEEPPFVGLGFAPNRDQLIREYKIEGVGLPHGAEIWELTEEGVEHRHAVLDTDLGQWLLVPAEPQAADDRQER